MYLYVFICFYLYVCVFLEKGQKKRQDKEDKEDKQEDEEIICFLQKQIDHYNPSMR